jgi:hypothetical protein
MRSQTFIMSFLAVVCVLIIGAFLTTTFAQMYATSKPLLTADQKFTFASCMLAIPFVGMLISILAYVRFSKRVSTAISARASAHGEVEITYGTEGE